MPNVVVTGASVYLDDGVEVARIEAVVIGGGERIVGQLHGQDVTEPDPVFHRFHVRLLAPDRMISDELREAQTYDEAVAVAEKYAALRAEHADRIADLAANLRV